MCWKQMHCASCVAFFCAAFFRIRITTRVPQNSMNSCGFLVSTEKSRSQRFELTSSHTHHHTSRPVGRMAGTGCVDRGRGVQPSIAGAWCIRPSQARGASFHRGRGVHLSIAGPGSIAVADGSCPGQCCSAHANPAPRACAACRRWRCCSTHAWLHARAQQCSGQLQSATAMEQPGPAIDSCPRSTASAMDGISSHDDRARCDSCWCMLCKDRGLGTVRRAVF